MHPQGTIQDSESSPSFNCYSSESSTSRSVAKVIREEQAAQFHEIADEEFEFALAEDASVKEIDSLDWTVFPVFSRHLSNDEVDREIKAKDVQIDVITGPLGKLFLGDPEESSSYSSSEVDELENLPSGTFCVWRPKADGGSSPAMTKCKKSSSAGSGSKRWRFRYLLRRSNSEGKEPMVLLSSKQADSPKHKRSSGRWKAQTPVHEQFYVQRRAENEVGKRKSYLPYRKDLMGLFAIANANGTGKMLPF